MKKAILIIYGILLTLGLSYLFWILAGNQGAQCFYMENFGVKCPGCGTTRMFLSMVKLDFISAFKYNPVMFVLFFFWNTTALLCFIGKPKWVKNQYFLASASLVSVFALILFGIIRIFC